MWSSSSVYGENPVLPKREDLATRPRSPGPGDLRDSQADNSALLALFPGLEPVPLEEGLRHTAAWFKQEIG